MSPRLRELEDNFKQSGGFYKDFRIGDLFIAYNGDFDIQKKHLNNKGEIVVSAGEQNCGVIGKTNIKARIFPPNTITCDMFGNVFYRNFSYKMVTHARIFSLHFLQSNLNDKAALYIISAMQFLKYKFSFSDMCSWNKIKNIAISLPVLPSDSNKIESINADSHNNYKIAFDYMESFIRELETERFEKLETYLRASGLRDYKLTDSERQALQDWGRVQLNAPPSLEGLSFKDFRIGDLFEIKPTKSYKMTNSTLFKTKGEVPVVTNSSLNNGISGYVALNPTEKGNIITYTDTTTSEGIFYQSRDFIGYSHVQALYSKQYNDRWNRYSLLYFVSAFRKVASGRFDYGNKFNRNIAREMKVSLPIYSNGKIAFDYMETFIQALQKEAIKDVVLWNEKELKATKDAINRI